MMEYWDWWLGALALGGITVLFQLLIGHRLGASSKWDRVVHWTSERETDRLDAAASADVDAFTAALREATMAEFSDAAGTTTLASPADSPNETATDTAILPQRFTTPASLLFLVWITVGAFIAAIVNGRFEVRGDMGPAFAEIVTDGPLMWPILFVGGVLVGVGTRMAGGCSTGHGLSGCSRFQPVSLLATCVFFGTAVVVSSLLYWVV